MNKVILMGRLTRDPETRVTPNNVVYARFSIAVDRRFAREGSQTVDFIPVVVWNKTAEFVSMYFKKGSRIAITGRLEFNSFQDKTTGENRVQAQVTAEEVYFAESKRDNQLSSNANFDFASNDNLNSQISPESKNDEIDFSDFAGADAFNIETEDDINFVE